MMSETLRRLLLAVGIASMGLSSATAQVGTRPQPSTEFTPAVGHQMPDGSADGPQVLPTGYLCDESGCAAVGGPVTSPGPRCLPIWGNFEYLLWWSQETDLPALAATSAAGTLRDNAAVVGLDSTTALFGGDSNQHNDSLSGARITLGAWIDPGQSTGLFGRWFGLEESESRLQTTSDVTPILGRPFFNALTDEQDALLLGFPNEISGSIDARYATETSGFQALVRQLFRNGCNYRLDLVYGYRHAKVEELLRIRNNLEFIDPAAATFGTQIDQIDQFDIENEFHGGEIGLMGHSVDGRFTMDFLATVALGRMTEQATMAGNTVSTPLAGDPFEANGGLLTQNSNIGTFEDDPFTVIPEFTVNIGYLITPRLDFSIGYTFLYISHVMRMNDAIDTSVNLNQQTGVDDGPAVPAITLNDAGFWVQGINFGLNLRY